MWKKFYGPLGLSIMAVMMIAAWRRLAGPNIWVTPLGWCGYLLFVDWLVYRRNGASLLMSRRKEFVIMLPVSVGLWCVFELHNLLFHNWEYQGIPANPWVATFGFCLAFAAILPALVETDEFLRSRHLIRVKISPQVYGKPQLITETIFGLMMIGIATFFPSPYTGVLVWPGYLFVFAPLNHLLGIPSVLAERKNGDLSATITLLLSGYICGLVWEFFNYWAAAKWIYHVPYLDHIKIFEMPVLGFLGFGPFAILFIEMYRFLTAAPSLLKSRAKESARMNSKSHTGVEAGRFQPCPPYPRCVSTQSKKPTEFIEPLSFECDAAMMLEKAQRTIECMEGSRLVGVQENYLHFEFRTRWLRFVDDVEVYVDAACKKVHFRSASRVGYYDFKTNRHRVEEIKRRVESFG